MQQHGNIIRIPFIMIYVAIAIYAIVALLAGLVFAYIYNKESKNPLT
jgi:hypothetical protein